MGTDEQYRFDSFKQDSLYSSKLPSSYPATTAAPLPSLNTYVPKAVLPIPELTHRVAKDAT